MTQETTQEVMQRSLTFLPVNSETKKRIESDYYVEGYATTFDKYVLMERNGRKIYEEVARNAFDQTDMSDVLFQFDHDQFVYARTGNGSLGIEVDDHGLFIWADLSRTSRARQLYEDIQAGNITQMSIRCRAATSFDGETQTIERVSKLIDVSAVSIPANNHTEIIARKVNEYDNERKRKKLALKLKVNTER